jgi:hypothetical protein
MCCQCGEIVQHRLDKGEALPCGNGHLVPATIARASLVKPGQPQPAAPAAAKPNRAPKIIRVRNMSANAQRRRAIKAHNQQMRAPARFDSSPPTNKVLSRDRVFPRA